ncbi:MAG TPA: hydrogenase maturation protease [Terriglobales bacterium]|nr:hydrogenase maturation protease [Terriglobales bacterium]
MRIIGCGNLQRGDDAAGILVAQRLRELGLEARTCSGDPLALIDAWSGADDVIVVDAVTSGAPAGSIRTFDAQDPAVFLNPSASTHGMGVAEAIAMARELDRLPARLRIFAIEGRRFDLGAGLSPEVKRAVNKLVRQLAAQCAVMADAG